MNWRHRTPEPDLTPTPHAPEASPPYMELDRARRLLMEPMTRGRNRADRDRARRLYMDLLA